MSVGACAIEGLYAALCRDPDTAAGGVTPSEDTYHASRFFRHVGTAPFNDLPGDGLDRCVEVVYPGADAWTGYTSSSASPRMRLVPLVVRVGYFAGSHQDQTHAIMADDDRLLGLAIKAADLPRCTGSCVNGYYPTNSTVVMLDPTRWVLEITVRVTVTA